MVLQIKWDVRRRLRYGNYVLSEGVGDPRFIKDVGVLSAEITHNDVGPVNQTENVLNDGGVLPDVLRPQDFVSCGRSRGPYRIENGFKPWREGRHYGNEIRIKTVVWNLENAWSESNCLAPARRGRNAFLFPVVLGHILGNYVKIFVVPLYNLYHHADSVSCIVIIAETEASKQPIVACDEWKLSRIGTQSLPVASIEILDGFLTERYDALTIFGA